MSSEQSKAVVQGWFDELVNKNNPAVADKYMDAAYINHFFPAGGPVGPEAEQQITVMFYAAFPDLKGTLEDIFADGDKVATRITWRGTNTGSLMGMPPTGKHVSFGVNNIFRIVNGKIAENWPQVDMMGLMQQLGAIPAAT